MTENFFIVALLYLAVVALAEAAYFVGVDHLFTRKIAHIGGGVVTALLPYFVSQNGAVFVGVTFAALLFVAKRKKIIASVYEKEDGCGGVFFPLGLALCAALFWTPNILIFQWAVLVFAFSDGLAGLAGRNAKGLSYSITGNKTVRGSIVFFIITAVLLSAAVIFSTADGMTLAIEGKIFLASLFLTLIEGAFGKGSDNLFLPVAAGAILCFLL